MRLLDESTIGVRSGPSVQRTAVMLIALAVFLIQLLALGVHTHAIADDESDCPTCQLVIDAPLLPSPGDLDVTPGSPGQAYHAQPTQYRSNTLSATFLTPPSHAPPVVAI